MIGYEQIIAPIWNHFVTIVLGQRSHWRATFEVLSFESCHDRVRLSDKRKMLIELPCSAWKRWNRRIFDDITVATVARESNRVNLPRHVGGASQGGNFGKKIRFCRPTADPTKKLQGHADRSPIRRRFSPTADFVGSADFPRLPIQSAVPIFRNPKISI